jgi:D-alanyl-D-alanine carboxypeptidase/D-alanyl-D-alanine-endopeptidase (penicillin-binding protein 4)
MAYSRPVRRRLILAALLLGCLLLAGPAAAASETANQIGQILSGEGLGGTGTGVAVVDTDSGALVVKRNAWRKLIPASNEKLFTTATAFSRLGPEFKFTTRVTASGLRVGKTWHGNLYLIGSGDPTFSHDQVATLVRELKRRGIRRIQGRIYGDETIFDTLRYGPQWKRAYIGIESPPLSGLALNRDVGDNGRVVPVPARAAARDLRTTLIARGIAVSTTHVGVGKAPAAARLLAAVDSPPLWRIVRFMDQQSDNFTAEMLLKSIGAYAGAGGTTTDGVAIEREVLSSLIPQDIGLVRMIDGSGLSRANRSTASAFAHLLAAAAGDTRLGPAMSGALSVAGVNGTLRSRLAHMGVRGKTGTLDGVSSLSGYVTNRSGQRLAFSILMNGPFLSLWKAHEAQDRIVQSLADSTSATTS